MQIAGIQKTTLVDYPGKVAATIFTRGCSFRCPFCHNPELVIPNQFNPIIDQEEIINFLKKRAGKLEAVCITGGEPLLQKDIGQFIKTCKDLGYLVKLDTNGSFPEKLEDLIKQGNLDYIAMDIKTSLGKYQSIVDPNRTLKIQNLKENIRKSIKLIMESNIDYEFRTTVCHPLHEVDDFKEIAQMFQEICHSGLDSESSTTKNGSKYVKRYFIQNFVQSKHNDETMEFEPFSDEELLSAKNLISPKVNEVGLR